MTTVNIDQLTPPTPLPDAVYYGAARAADVEALPFAFNCNVKSHYLASAGVIDPRPPTYVHYDPVQSVSGNRLGITQAGHFSSYANQWLQGGSVDIYRMSRVGQAAPTISHIKRTTCTQFYANAATTSNTSINGSQMLGPSEALTFHMYFPGWSAPSATLYFRIGSVNAAGEVAWSDTASHTTPSTVNGSDPGAASGLITAPTLQIADDHSDTATGLGAPTGVTVTPRANASIVDITGNKPANTTGVVGYIMRWWPADPDTVPHNDIEVADGTGVQVGDIVLIQRDMPLGITRSEINHPRVWGIGAHPVTPFERFSSQIPVDPSITLENTEDTNGRALYRLTLPAGASMKLVCTTFGGSDQSFYSVPSQGATYGVDMEMRRVSGDGDVSFTIPATGGVAAMVPSKTWPLTSSFNLRREAFTGITYASGSIIGPEWVFNGGTGGTVIEFYPGSYWIGRTANGFSRGQLSPDDAAVAAQFVTSDGRTLCRWHNNVKGNPKCYSLEKLIDPEWVSSQAAHFEFCLETGASPWIQPEWPPLLRPADTLAFAEWLLAPYNPASDTPASKPWAYKRYASGRTAPWIDAFDLLAFEISNEMWTPGGKLAFFGVPIPAGYNAGEVAGAMNRLVADTLMSSPYWTQAVAAKVRFFPGGWIATNYNEGIAAAMQGVAEAVTINGYIGQGWEELRGGGSGESFSFSAEIVHSRLQITPTQFEDAFSDISATLSPYSARLGGYEWQITTAKAPSSSIPASEVDAQDRAWGCNAMQAAVVDQFCLGITKGVLAPAFFTMTADQYWGTHQAPVRGGGVRAAWQLLGKLNQLGFSRAYLPESLQTVRADVEDRDGVTVDNLPQIGRYRFDGPSGKSIIVLVSRRIPGQGADVGNTTIASATSRVLWPLERSYTGTVWTTTGDWQTHNSTLATANDIALTSTSATFDGTSLVTDLPPGMVQIIELTP